MTANNTIPITVIMPAYNAEKFLDESIPSILDQTFKNFEFIIIDDFSTDKTPSIIEKYAAQDSRIIYIRNSTNINNIATRNKAIERARGAYIAELDGDDAALPHRLEIQYNHILKHPDITLIGAGAEIIDGSDRVIGNKRPDENFDIIRYKMMFRNPFVHSTIFYKTDIIKKLGCYDPEYPHAEDYHLYSKLINNGYRIINMPEVLIRYRRHSQSITGVSETRNIQLDTSLRISRDNINKYMNLSETDAGLLVDTLNRRPSGLMALMKALKIHKKLVRQYIKKEELDPVQSQKILNIYESYKKIAAGSFLKAEWPHAYSLLKYFRK